MQVRERVSRFDVGAPRVRSLPFGLKAAEIVAGFIVIAFVAITVTYYWTSLRPEQERLSQLERLLAEQQRDLVPVGALEQSTASPADAAKDALESLERFKTGHLKGIRSGEIQLLNDLNALAKKSSVQLTSGIDTTTRLPGQSEEDTSGGKKSQRQKKPDEILSVFPALATRFSVAGDYANLRSFISALESSKQFLVVKNIAIISQEGKTTGRNRRNEATGGLVLSIEMIAYFHP